MGLERLKPASGATRGKKRVGRGPGSGLGKTAGRGHKGAKSRSGYSLRRGFEGGQMPLVRRVPKRGFRNKFAKRWATVNVSDLDRFDDGTVVTPELLLSTRVVRDLLEGVRVLGKGELNNKKLVVEAQYFSAGARSKIEAAGGRVEVVKA